MAMTIIQARGRTLIASASLLASVVLLASCSSGEQRHAQSPTSPSVAAEAATSDTAGGTGSTSSADPGTIVRSPASPWFTGPRNSSQAVEFPRRDETFQFRQQLETTYRDGLRRPATSSFVDIEGTIVWTAEYLRYRVNGCGHQEAIARVTAQIQGRGVQPVCVDFTGTSVNFPPRNEPFAFRQELERLYRDELRRSAVQSFVDAEGDIVWTQEYLRYRLNGCGHPDAVDRTLSQVTGGPVQAVCSGGPVTPPPPPPPTSIASFVTTVTAPGASTTLINSPRPNAGAGPIITPSGSGGLVTLTASSPIDRVIVSVNTIGASALEARLTPMVVLGSYYEVRLSSAQTTVQLTIQGAGSFNLEFAGSLGGGPLGPYQPQPFSMGLNLTGTWRGTTSSESGSGQVVFVLTQSGTRVTGRAFNPDFIEFANDLEGTISGSTFNFSLRFPGAFPPECNVFDSRGTAQVTQTTMTGTATSTVSCFGETFTGTASFQLTRQQ
jgi:hypothetical protein